MSQIAEILGDLVVRYFEHSASVGGECRIVVPGLTRHLAQEIQAHLRGMQKPSYLVVDQDETPDRQRQWMRADGLTTKREGSLIIVSYPGVLSLIQDSIRGSGGTIRSEAYSDEWPWLDNGNEAFRFDGPFLDALLDKWCSDQGDRDWMREIILKGLIPATSGHHDRANLLLCELLDSFDPQGTSEELGLREMFLNHCGLPWDKDCGEKSAKELCQSVSGVCTNVLDACTGPDVRQEVADRISTSDEIEDDERARVLNAANAFLDGMGSPEVRLTGVLGLRHCWGGDLELWRTLTTKMLLHIFGRQDEPDVQISADVTCDRGIYIEDRRVLATFVEETIALDVHFRGLPSVPEGTSGFELRVMQRSREIFGPEPCTEPEGSIHVEFTGQDISNHHRSSFLVKAQLVHDNRVHAEWRLRLHLCGDERPAFMLMAPMGVTVNAQTNEDQDTQKIETDEKVTAYLLETGTSSDAQPVLRANDNALRLDEAARGIYILVEVLDPGQAPGGEVLLEALFRAGLAAVLVAARDMDRGEFTLEDEARVALLQGSKRKVKRLAEILAGNSTELYPSLGGMDEQARQRSHLARLMEERADGGLPVVLDISSGKQVTSAIEEVHPCARTLTVGGRSDFPHSQISAAAEDLLSAYHAARGRLLAEVRTLVDDSPRPDRPMYAALPSYVDARRQEIELLLVPYLEAYRDILTYMEEGQGEIGWAELFALTFVDCAVNWSRNGGRNAYFLVGPWHPLTVAKRFMMQGIVFRCLRRFLTTSDTSFASYAGLLASFDSFRWLLSLGDDDAGSVPAYTAATSDPGWHLALRVSAGQRGMEIALINKVRREVSALLGLTYNMLPSVRHIPARHWINSYLQAHPADRCVGVRVAEGYDAERIIGDAHELLHGTEDEVTETGARLPGGIHVFLDHEDDGDVPLVEWKRPPVVAYSRGAETAEDQDALIQLSLRPPLSRVSLSQASVSTPVPRGAGNESALALPLLRLSEGASGTPTSLLYEHTSPAEENGDVGIVGAVFTDALALLQRVPAQQRYALARSTDLPARLLYPWTVFPGQQLDPAVFVQYIRDGYERDVEERALWDYRAEMRHGPSSEFVLSTVPGGLRAALEGSPVLAGTASGNQMLRELGQVGIAMGSEAMRSGRRASGVLGLVAAVRLLRHGTDAISAPLLESSSRRTALLPVDSFPDVLGLHESTNGPTKRGDLLCVCVDLAEGSRVRITHSAVECKYTQGTMSDAQVDDAFEQARATERAFAALVEGGLRTDGVLERLVLCHIIGFGLRLTATSADSDTRCAGRILRAVLRGEYDVGCASAPTVLVSTEVGFGRAEIRKRVGWWVRVAPGHWPGVSESGDLQGVRQEIATLFPLLGEEASPTQERGEELPSEQQASGGSAGAEAPPPEPEEADGVDGGVDDSDTMPRERALLPVPVGVGRRREVAFYDPSHKTQPLDNFNIMVTGSAGKGKTALLRSVMIALRKQGKNALVLDFKNDFATDEVFLERSRLTSQFVTFDGLPYNPLVPSPSLHPRSGEAVLQIGQHVNEVSAVLRKAYQLGAQQEFAVKEAIRECFAERGIPTSGTAPFSEGQVFPDFADVGQKLEETNAAARRRLDPLFDLGIFRPEFRDVRFQELLGRSTVIQMSDIRSDYVKNALAQLIVLSAHTHYNTQSHTTSLRQCFVFDEAHRVLGSDYLPSFVRECRAYGVAVVLSSQYPTDFSPDVSGCMATRIIHGNGTDEPQVRAITSLLNLRGQEDRVASLGMFEAIVSNSHVRNEFVHTLAYPQRLVCEHLQENGCTGIDGIRSIDGLNPERCEQVVEFLREAGLVEETSAGYSLVESMPYL